MPVYEINFSKAGKTIVWTYYSDKTWKSSSPEDEKDFQTFLEKSIENGWTINYGKSIGIYGRD